MDVNRIVVVRLTSGNYLGMFQSPYGVMDVNLPWLEFCTAAQGYSQPVSVPLRGNGCESAREASNAYQDEPSVPCVSVPLRGNGCESNGN